MTRDKMGECESASRHPRMATRLSNEQNGAETERERTTSWFDLQGEDVVKVVNLKKIHRPISPSLIFYVFLLIELRSFRILSLGSISPLVQWSLTKVILALGFGFNLTVLRLFLLS